MAEAAMRTLACWLLVASLSWAEGTASVDPVLTLRDAGAEDQDDMCVWVDASDPSRSVVIGSDKKAAKLFVYGLDGKTLHVVTPPGKPGNIDVRCGLQIGGEKVDIVGFNDRDHALVCVYRIDPKTRALARIDDGEIATTDPNYGFALYHSAVSGKLYAFVSHEGEGPIEQFELSDDGKGKVTGAKVREWQVASTCEGIAADDERGRVYIAEEDRGVWELGAEPGDETPGELVVRVGENGLEADCEGVAIWRGADGKGYLLLSSQGNDSFKVYDRAAPHAFLGSFAITGAKETDGIEAPHAPLGDRFPDGVFLAHDGGPGITLTPWDRIASALGLGTGDHDGK